MSAEHVDLHDLAEDEVFMAAAAAGLTVEGWRTMAACSGDEGLLPANEQLEALADAIERGALPREDAAAELRRLAKFATTRRVPRS